MQSLLGLTIPRFDQKYIFVKANAKQFAVNAGITQVNEIMQTEAGKWLAMYIQSICFMESLYFNEII